MSSNRLQWGQAVLVLSVLAGGCASLQEAPTGCRVGGLCMVDGRIEIGSASALLHAGDQCVALALPDAFFLQDDVAMNNEAVSVRGLSLPQPFDLDSAQVIYSYTVQGRRVELNDCAFAIFVEAITSRTGVLAWPGPDDHAPPIPAAAGDVW